jgi:alpha,alpha-trehalase
VWGGYYEDGSLIWRSRWVTETGIIECREALAFPGQAHRAVLLRRIIAVQGTAHVKVVVEPAAEFGRAHLRELHRDDDGRWEGRVGELRMRWSGNGANTEVNATLIHTSIGPKVSSTCSAAALTCS